MITMESRPQSLAVDIIVVWMGNELVGKRGVFVDPNTPNWAQNLDNMQALGVWPEVASAECGQIQRLAASRPQGQADGQQCSDLGGCFPHRLQVAHRVQGSGSHVFKYARGRGVFTGSLEVPVANVPKYDGYYFREDSTHRAAFANCIARRARCVQAEATLGRLSAEDTQFLMDNFPFDQFGERVYPMRHVFDRAFVQRSAIPPP